ncbi:uncharacterized protein TEOVI_000763100 [Trypanosoma equiperdum]|uniref:Uncharacterized protein n=1 Tax=Trypanosoma equiperdum TaxID=5694 RepID=A0A1G4I287_TRYEQ|nr:hypothetical protein TEOVI_000763100 [Trypanosoma equiperdum]
MRGAGPPTCSLVAVPVFFFDEQLPRRAGDGTADKYGELPCTFLLSSHSLFLSMTECGSKGRDVALFMVRGDADDLPRGGRPVGHPRHDAEPTHVAAAAGKPFTPTQAPLLLATALYSSLRSMDGRLLVGKERGVDCANALKTFSLAVLALNSRRSSAARVCRGDLRIKASPVKRGLTCLLPAAVVTAVVATSTRLGLTYPVSLSEDARPVHCGPHWAPNNSSTVFGGPGTSRELFKEKEPLRGGSAAKTPSSLLPFLSLLSLISITTLMGDGGLRSRSGAITPDSLIRLHGIPLVDFTGLTAASACCMGGMSKKSGSLL